VEKALTVSAVDATNDVLCAPNSANTAKSAHTAADAAGEEVNHDGASELYGKLNEEIENHEAMMALMGQSVQAGKNNPNPSIFRAIIMEFANARPCLLEMHSGGDGPVSARLWGPIASALPDSAFSWMGTMYEFDGRVLDRLWSQAY
jgi:hypothetical protein